MSATTSKLGQSQKPHAPPTAQKKKRRADICGVNSREFPRGGYIPNSTGRRWFPQQNLPWRSWLAVTILFGAHPNARRPGPPPQQARSDRDGILFPKSSEPLESSCMRIIVSITGSACSGSNHYVIYEDKMAWDLGIHDTVACCAVIGNRSGHTVAVDMGLAQSAGSSSGAAGPLRNH